jgi:hypothetical protein
MFPKDDFRREGNDVVIFFTIGSASSTHGYQDVAPTELGYRQSTSTFDIHHSKFYIFSFQTIGSASSNHGYQDVAPTELGCWQYSASETNGFCATLKFYIHHSKFYIFLNASHRVLIFLFTLSAFSLELSDFSNYVTIGRYVVQKNPFPSSRIYYRFQKIIVGGREFL